MLKNIMIFGGSFDPIHEGHLALIKNAFTSFPSLDSFVLFPTGSHPELKNYLFSNQERLIMIKACLGQLDTKDVEYINTLGGSSISQDISPHPVIISEQEMDTPKRSYTIDTIEYLEGVYPDTQLHLLIGADQAEKFSTWRKAEEIAQKVILWTFPRENFQYDSNFSWNIIEAPKLDISSSFIRSLLLEKKSLNLREIPLPVQILAPLFLKNKQN